MKGDPGMFYAQKDDFGDFSEFQQSWGTSRMVSGSHWMPEQTQSVGAVFRALPITPVIALLLHLCLSFSAPIPGVLGTAGVSRSNDSL